VKKKELKIPINKVGFTNKSIDYFSLLELKAAFAHPEQERHQHQIIMHAACGFQ
jgi:hypothetical protein